MITQDQLKEHVLYNKDTGEFIRISRWSKSSAKLGEILKGSKKSYLQIGIMGKPYWAHRLAWLYVFGEFPNGFVDHINGIRSDNRINNLRIVDASGNSQNMRKATKANKSSGLIGAYFDKRKKSNNWFSLITVNRVQKNLGYFPTKELAHEAYINEKRKVHKTCTL